MAGNNQKEVKLKEYRYSGKERDDSTGLYYYGARYYAPWLSRWLNPDPAGTVDGLNLYEFVGGNPVSHRDMDGRTKKQGRKVQFIRPGKPTTPATAPVPTPATVPSTPTSPPQPTWAQRLLATPQQHQFAGASLRVGTTSSRAPATSPPSTANLQPSQLLAEATSPATNPAQPTSAQRPVLPTSTPPQPQQAATSSVGAVSSSASTANLQPFESYRDVPRQISSRGFPLGFSSLEHARDITRPFAEAARDGKVFIRGSSVTNLSYNTNMPFRKESDIDAGIVSDRLFTSPDFHHKNDWMRFPNSNTLFHRLGVDASTSLKREIGIVVRKDYPPGAFMIRPHTPEAQRRRPSATGYAPLRKV